jgi:hypothetical protein
MAKKKKSNLPKSLDDKTHIPFVDRIVNQDKYPVRPNADGTVSSHLMAWGDDDEGFFAYPTLQYADGQFQEFQDPKYAKMRGNILRFDSAEKAEAFADGAWKEEYSFNYGGNLNTMANKKKNTSKKLPKDVSASMPYFLINSIGQIKEFAGGGDIGSLATKSAEQIGSIYDKPGLPAPFTATSDLMPTQSITDNLNPAGSLAGSNIGSAIGSTFSDLIGGNTNIAEDRNATKSKAMIGGAMEGAGTGFDIGSTIPLPGAGIMGAGIGLAAGAITSGNEKDKEIAAFKKSMTAKHANTDPGTTTYYGAYGGKLPEYSNGGDLPEVVVKAPSMIDNPNYNAQNALYRQSLTNRPADTLTATMDAGMLDSWNKYNQKTNPERTGFNATRTVYDPNSLDMSTGLPTQFLDYYDAPAKQFREKPTATMPTPEPKLPSFLDPSTGAALDAQVYGRPEGDTDVQFSQGLELTSRKLANINKKVGVEQEMNANKELLRKMSPDQQAGARTAGMTPTEYVKTNNITFANGGDLSGNPTEFNGNTHEQGGIQIGQAEVEDGEIRVGDYVFSDRLVNAEGKTFATEAKKITKRYEEYANDAPAMRTQAKILEELKLQNDQARQAKEAQDSNMRQDFAAYGGMIAKDKRGKYQVDKSNRLALLDAAKGRNMSYNKFISSVHAFGGTLDKDPPPLVGLDMSTPEPPKSLDLMGNMGNPVDLYAGKLDMSTPSAPEPLDLMGGMGVPVDMGVPVESEIGSLPIRELGSPLDNVELEGFTRTSAGEGLSQQTLFDKIKNNFNEEEQALLSSQLPNVNQLLNSNKKSNTTFDRVDLNELSLDDERRKVQDSVERARKIQAQNVRGTATSSGDALAALSAGNAGLTQSEMDAMMGISDRETNLNTQIKNQESMTNMGIANEEAIARQQDDAMRDSVRQLALSGLSGNYQGYIKDKKLAKENQAANKRLLSLLDTGEYEIVEDGEDSYKISYKAKKED